MGLGKIKIRKDFTESNAEPKVSLQAGLRGEYTRTDLGTPENPTLIQRQYFNLFPSVFV